MFIVHTGLAAMKGMMMGGMSLFMSMMMLSGKFGKGGGGGGPWQNGGGGGGGGMFISIFFFLTLSFNFLSIVFIDASLSCNF